MRVLSDALLELQNLFVAAETDPDFIKALQSDLLGLVNKAPLELHTSVPSFSAIREGKLAELISDVRSGLVSHLAKVE